MQDTPKAKKTLPFFLVLIVYLGTLLLPALAGFKANGMTGFMGAVIYAPLDNGGAIALPFILFGLIVRRWYVVLLGWLGVVWWCATGGLGI